MGFSISFRTTEQLSPARQREVLESLEQQAAGYLWLDCEPPRLMEEDGILLGASRLSFAADEDIASAGDDLPEGTINELLDCLCHVSKELEVAWEIAHNDSDGPLGYIRRGKCDKEARNECIDLADMAHELKQDGMDLEDLGDGEEE